MAMLVVEFCPIFIDDFIQIQLNDTLTLIEFRYYGNVA